METNFNFKSQICTSREQSERLLALGLKKETADMHWWLIPFSDDWRLSPFPHDDLDDIPAWSLHRLIEMNPTVMEDYELIVNSQRVGYFCSIGSGYSFDWFTKEGDTFDGIIDCIEWLIKEGYFNKEYLEE